MCEQTITEIRNRKNWGWLSDEQTFSVVSLRSQSSGVANNIFVGPWKLAHTVPIIHVQPDHRERFDLENLAVVSLETDPPQAIEGYLDAADLALVRRYIALNSEAILAHWRETTDGVELGRALKPLEAAPLTEPADQKLIERTLIAIQSQLATLSQRVVDVLDDQKSMREQVDVIVMTSLRLERAMTALRQDVRTLRERIDGLETSAPR